MMIIKNNKVSLDVNTLETLLNEASKNYEQSNADFEETDSTEAMHDAEHWQLTIQWLKKKIVYAKKSQLKK